VASAAGEELEGPPAPAAARLRLRPRQQGARHPGDPGMARAPVDHQHRCLHGPGAEPVQGLLAVSPLMIHPRRAGRVLREVSCQRPSPSGLPATTPASKLRRQRRALGAPRKRAPFQRARYRLAIANTLYNVPGYRRVGASVDRRERRRPTCGTHACNHSLALPRNTPRPPGMRPRARWSLCNFEQNRWESGALLAAGVRSVGEL
jgi:hypothetical protein